MSGPGPTQPLVDMAKAGDRAALDALIEASRGRLESFLGSRIRPPLRGRLEVDDLLQETFARALDSFERFHGEDLDSFVAWVMGIARHVLLKAIEKLGVHQPLQIDRDVTANGPSPSKALRRDERFDRLERAIGTLSADHQEVIRRVRIEGLSLEKVAASMQRSPEAVKKLLWRALKELRKAFGETESLHLPPRNLEPGGGHDQGR